MVSTWNNVLPENANKLVAVIALMFVQEAERVHRFVNDRRVVGRAARIQRQFLSAAQFPKFRRTSATEPCYSQAGMTTD
jgi:hypothetical protein